jgi:acylphosphatase
MIDARVHIEVSGVVQGVGFRYFVARCAERLRLAGRVRNLPDGSVEIVAEGPRPALEELVREVRTGPRMARVADVRVEWGEPNTRATAFTVE